MTTPAAPPGTAIIGRRVDHTGQTFGRLTAVAAVPSVAGAPSRWVCQCICGARRIVRTCDLMWGNVASCGCSRRRNLTGHRVGDFLVLRPAPPVPRRTDPTRLVTAWYCQCVCGRSVVVATFYLTRRLRPVTHCGCRHLRPTADQDRLPAMGPQEPLPAGGMGPQEVWPATTAQQWLTRLHDEQSPLGRVRRVGRPVNDEDDGIGRALCDGDPFQE